MKGRYNIIQQFYCCNCNDGPAPTIIDSICVSCGHILCHGCPTKDIRVYTVLESTAPINTVQEPNANQSQTQGKEREQRINEEYSIQPDQGLAQGLEKSNDHGPKQNQMPSVGQEREQSLESQPESKRRKLDLVKCDRCRIDKQKCSPSNRAWPVKCNRCISKEFPCSEGKKLERKSKYVLEIPPAIVPGSADIPEYQSFLHKWSLFTGYCNNLTKAMEYLKSLQEETFGAFQATAHSSMRTQSHSSLDQLDIHVRNISRHVMKLAKYHFETGGSVDTLPGPSILSSILSIPSMKGVCPICEGEEDVEILEALEQSEDIFSQFQLRQNRLEAHFKAPIHHHDHAKIREERSQYQKLSNSLTSLVKGYLEKLELNGATITSLFHSSVIGHDFFNRGLELPDCLGRSSLHQSFDTFLFDRSDFFVHSYFRSRSAVNKQDILGRSPLHIACQKGWKNRTRDLLFEGADPKLATIYGSLPLHYAAANGHVQVSRSLIDNMETKDINKRDCEGKRPLDYARKKGHTEVVKLLA